MKAVTWLGRRDVAVADVPDPRIDEPTDAIIKITSTNICGSDLHLYETIGASMSPGDVLGHESLGVVLEVGSKVTTIKPGDRVVIPFQHSRAEWTAVAAEADVVSDRLLAASAEGVPVLVTGPPEGTVLVLADRCTHRGAPLHDGELRCGCIVCPWHGSEFALDGSVVRGPATRPQAAYETQVVDGRVFVRRADEPRSLRTNPVS